MKLSRTLLATGALILVGCFITIGSAQNAGKGPGYVLIPTRDWPAGSKVIVITTDANGRHTWAPLPVTPQTGSDPGTPSPPGQSPGLKEAVIKATQAVNDSKKDDNSMGIAVLYALVSSRVSEGSLEGDKSAAELRQLTDAYLKKQGAGESWKPWRSAVGKALKAEADAGRLSSNIQIAAAYDTIAKVLTGEMRLSRAQFKGRFLKILRVVLQVIPEIINDGDIDIIDLINIISQLLGQRS
tara:strand:+ start:1443 stop:2165 length:723 start_codon:yes stop_codon:yes gene_type:complete